MNCEELNKRYGAPGRIVFREGAQGYPIVALANQYGSAELSLFGAQVRIPLNLGRTRRIMAESRYAGPGSGRMVLKVLMAMDSPVAVFGA